jgi:hypothetical protein
MDIPISDCCNAKIEQSNNNFTSDICVECGSIISYALVGDWAKGFHESFAVCELFNGEYYYYWHAVTKFNSILERYSKDTYIGQIKNRWSITSELDMDGDCIDPKEHKRFSDSWKDKVKNPSYAI